MAVQFNRVPQFLQPLSVQGVTSRDWYFFWDALFRGLAPGNETAVTLDSSPATYSATVKGSLIVSGGTVSLIEFSRDGTTFYDTGQTAGMFALNAADRLRVTYTVLPDAVFVPS
jgi:hypothetical protein